MMERNRKYDAYKNSGHEWIGDIPSHWDMMLLNYLFVENKTKNKGNIENTILSLSYGRIILKKGGDNYGLLPASFETYQILEPDYLVFRFTDLQNDRRSLRVGYVDQKGIITSAYVGLKNRIENVCSKYYYYLFHSLDIKKYFYSFGGGVRLSLDYSTLKKIKFPNPTFAEQKSIANFLDHKTTQIDNFIRTKEKTIALLQERKAAIINQAVTKGLDPNVPMKDSGIEWLGEIPEHWEVKKLKFIAKLFGRIGFRGYQTSDLVQKGEGAITLSPSNMKEKGMDYSKCSYLSWKKYEESPEIQIHNNDILMVKTGSTYGKVVSVTNLPEKATINPQILVVKEIKLNNKFLSYFLKSKTISDQVEFAVIGGTIPTISQTKIGNFYLMFPELDEQNEIVEKIEERFGKLNSLIFQNKKEISIIKEYRESLISTAVTGKIDVRDYQKTPAKYVRAENY